MILFVVDIDDEEDHEAAGRVQLSFAHDPRSVGQA